VTRTFLHTLLDNVKSSNTRAGLVYRKHPMNIIKNRYFYFLISLLVIIPGIVFMILNLVNIKTPFPLGIDFTGGSLLEVQFTGSRPSADKVISVFESIAPDTAPAVQPLVRMHTLFVPKELMMQPKGKLLLPFKTKRIPQLQC